MEPQQRFKGLDEIRALLAFSVIIHHVGQNGKMFGIQTFDAFPLGHYAVSCFFGLSGFLITYLLLKEKDTGKIDMPKFYLRRILRIWPIYYLILILSIVLLIVFPAYFNLANYFLYIFPLGNIAKGIHLDIHLLSHYWSLALEEQFYLLWPLVIGYAKTPFKILIYSFAFLVSSKIITLLLLNNVAWWDSPIAWFLYVNRFEGLIVGAFAAYVLYSKSSVGQFLTQKWVQWPSIIVLLVSIVSKLNMFGMFDQLIVSIVFTVTMFNIVNGTFVLSISNRILANAGKWSYGIYMYHFLVLYCLSIILQGIELPIMLKSILVYAGTIGVTVLVSYISFTYFETYFLKMKRHKVVLE